MNVQKSFKVFGQKTDILVTTEMSQGAMTALVLTSGPGEGIPTHSHALEDELLTVLEGEYEIFDGVTWHKLHQGESYFARRNEPHAFRYIGTTSGRAFIVVSPAGLENYLERLSPLLMPEDLDKIQKLSAEFGLRLVT